jgi:fibronectin-binding autotransporter adhesin
MVLRGVQDARPTSKKGRRTMGRARQMAGYVSRRFKKSAIIITATAICAVDQQSARAITTVLYWDTNGSSTGADHNNTATGIWDTTTNNWNLNSTGVGAAQAWVNDGSGKAIFAAGTDTTGQTYTVTLGSTSAISVNTINFNEGTVIINPGTSSTLTLAGTGPVINVAAGLTATINQAMGGTGGMMTAGTGTLVLGAQNTYSGVTDIYGASIKLGINNALPVDSFISSLLTGPVLDLGGFNQAANNPAVVTNSSTTLSTYTIDSTVTGVAGFNGTITGKTAVVFNSSVSGANGWEFNGADSFTGGLTVNGGEIELTNSRSFSGGVTVNTGAILQVDSDAALGATTGNTITINGGTLSSVQTYSTARAIGIGTNGATFNVGTGKSVTFSGVIGGSGGTSGGGLTVNGAGTVDLLGVNTYGTSTTVSGGELITGIAGALPSSDDLILHNSVTVNLAGNNQTVASLSSNITGTTGTVTNSSATPATLSISRPPSNPITNFSFYGTITGNLSLIKGGASTQALNAVNTYTGSTTITGGSLVTSIAGALPAGTDVSIGQSGALNLNGFSQTIASLSGNGATLLNGGTLTVNGSSTTTYAGVISDGAPISGGLIKSGTGTLTLTNNSTFAGPLNVTSGTLNISGNMSPSSIYVGGPSTPPAGGGAIVNQSAGTITDSGSASIASVSGDIGTYNLTGGALSVATDFTLGVDNPAHAVFNLNTAGFLSVTETEYINGMFTEDIDTTNTAGQFAVGYTASSNGTYDMENGILNGGAVENIGYQGTANFIQNGGIHNTAEMFISAAAGQTSTYTMTDGSLNIFVPENPNDLYIGGMAAGTASFSQSGGTVTIDGALDLSHVSGLYGSYDLSGGTLTAAAEYIGDGGSGTFTQELGSTNNAQFMEIGSQASSVGTYTISGGTLNLTGVSFDGPLIVGNSGTGTLNISGNTFVNTSGNVDVGLSSGSIGTVNQTGGTVSVGSSTSPADLFIARNAGSTGSYSLSGDTSLTVWSGMFLGYQGAGTFTQNGGQVAVKEVNGNGNTGFLSIGNNNPTSVGTYTISAGNLSADTGIYIGGTPGNGGGTGSSLNILGGSVNSGLQVFAGNSLTINGGTLNAGFTVNGTGSLISGSITATNSLEYISGSTAVFTQSGGGNTVTAGNSLGSGVLAVYSGATYNLNGGTINSPNVDIGGVNQAIGAGTLNIATGGALTATTTLTVETTGTINLNTGGSFSTVNLLNNGLINLNGGTYNVSGTTSGIGTIAQTGGTTAAADGTQINNNTYTVKGASTTFTSPGSISVGVTSNAVTAVTIGQQATANITGNLNIANTGSLGTGSSTSVVSVNVSNNASLTAHAIVGGNVFGGTGTLNVTTGGTVSAAGVNATNLTVADSTFQIVTQPPQTGDDPDLIGAIAVGYSQVNATATVSGSSTVTAPVIKLGPTTGNTGTWTQTGGTVTTGTFAAGNDANVGSVSGTGIANVSGGALNATSLLVGGDDAQFQARKTGVVPLGDPGGGGNQGGPSVMTISGNANVTATTTQITTNGQVYYNGGSFSPGDLTIDGGGLLVVGNNPASPDVSGVMPLGSGTTPTVLVLHSLTINGSSNLDLSNNDAVVQTTALSTVAAYLQSGYQNGAWNGSGLISSVAAKTPSLTALGVELNAQQNIGTGAYTNTPILTQWENITVALNNVLVKYTLAGDADLSGHVDGTDYTLIDEGFDSKGKLTGWRNGDFNYDGFINGDDYTLIDNVFDIEQSAMYNVVPAVPGSAGEPAEMIASDTEQIATSVPEPGSLALAAMGVASLLRRRRRRG